MNPKKVELADVYDKIEAGAIEPEYLMVDSRKPETNMNENIYLRVEKALTPAERDLFLAGAVKLNPRLDGAHVADVLDMLANEDALLEVVEPMHERHGSDTKTAGLLTAACHVVWFWNKAQSAVPFSDEQVLALCARVESGEIAAGRDP